MMRYIAAALAGMAALTATAADAQRDQDSAYRQVRDGRIMQLGDILAQVTPQVGGKFIGSEFDPNTAMYRLRFMRGGEVTNVDVDARTGRIIGRGAF